MANDFTVDLALTNTSPDKVAVLGAEVHNDDSFSFGPRSFLPLRAMAALLLGDLQVGRDLGVTTGGQSTTFRYLGPLLASLERLLPKITIHAILGSR